MAYVIELPTGQLAMTLEPSLLSAELAAIDALKLAIPARARSYDGKTANDTRIWTIEAEFSDDLYAVFANLKLWLASISERNLWVYTPAGLRDFHESSRAINVGFWKLATNWATNGYTGKKIAQLICANTDLPMVLAASGAISASQLAALNQPATAAADFVMPTLPVEEAGELQIAYIVRSKNSNYPPHLGYTGRGYEPARYRFSLIAAPDNFCGKFSQDQITVWAEQTERANFDRLGIPVGLDISNHYTALDLHPLKVPARIQARAAFAKASLLYHPDHNKASNAAEMFGYVKAAWDFFKRANDDDTGRMFKMYNATVKIKQSQGAREEILMPVIDERLTAAWLVEHVNCGLFTGAWTRDTKTGEIVIQRFDDLVPLIDPMNRIWTPFMQDNSVIGAWLNSAQYASLYINPVTLMPDL